MQYSLVSSAADGFLEFSRTGDGRDSVDYSGSKRTDILALNGGNGGAEAQTDVLVPSTATLARPGGLDLGLAVEEDCGGILSAFLLPNHHVPVFAPAAAATAMQPFD